MLQKSEVESDNGLDHARLPNHQARHRSTGPAPFKGNGIGARGLVNRVLQRAGDSAIIFRRRDHQTIGPLYAPVELQPPLRDAVTLF